MTISSKLLLGVDVGERRVGVAISERGTRFALPLETHDRRISLQRLTDLVRLRSADVVVIGWPIGLDGKRNRATERVASYEALLLQDLQHANLSPLVVRSDERMTTVLADHLLNEASLFGRKRKSVVDQVAAVEILRSYLSQHHS